MCIRDRYHDDQNLIEALAYIQSTYGKFAVWGNRDYGGGASREYEKIMEQGGFQVLCNEYAVITFDMEEEILIAGLDDALLGNPDVQWMADPNLLKEKQFSILLTHLSLIHISFEKKMLDIMKGKQAAEKVDEVFGVWQNETLQLMEQ